MTIEQEFFEAFGIEPELNCKNCLKFNDGESIYGAKGGCYDGSKETKKCYSLYPSITPEIVLKLAATLNDIVFSKIECCCLFTGKTVGEITNNILSDCIDHKDEIQDQVRVLFNA